MQSINNYIPHFVILLLLLSLKQLLFSQNIVNTNEGVQLESRGEVYFCFPIKNQATKELNCVSIDNIKNDTAFAYANREEFEAFLALQLPYKVLPPPSLLITSKNMHGERMSFWSGYPTYSQYDSLMHSFARKYSSICQLTEFGQSVNGRALYALKISDRVQNNETEPEVFLTSTMHGDEVTGYILMLQLANYLLTNYRSDSIATAIVDNYELWINPNANPDGTYAMSDSSVYGATRYNANNQDLNRDFPSLTATNINEEKEYQPETQFMMAFMESHNFVLSANFHGGAEVVNYPWDTWERLHADNKWFMHLSRQYTETVKQFGGEDYFSDVSPTGYTNGFQWYTVDGGRQDYATYFMRCREVTIEVSSQKVPPPSEQHFYWEVNKKAILSYILLAGKGIHGVILDSLTKQPLEASIEIPVHDSDHSSVLSSKETGDFHRLIEPGKYNLLVNAPGYYSKTIAALELASYNSDIWLDNILLSPRTSPQIYFSVQTSKLWMMFSQETEVDISIYNLLGSKLYQFNNLPVGPVNQPISLTNILHTGNYAIRIAEKGKIIKTLLIYSP